MSKRGRPIKLTPALQETLCGAIREGNYIETACAFAGVSRQTVRNWMKRGARQSKGIYRDFLDALKKSHAIAEAENVRVIRAAAKEQWYAAAWMLERRYPKRWGKNDKVRNEVTGANGGSISVAINEALTRIYGNSDNAGEGAPDNAPDNATGAGNAA